MIAKSINGDPGPVSEACSHGSDVPTMYPLGGTNLGWEEVRAGSEQAAQAMSEGQVSLDNSVVLSGVLENSVAPRGLFLTLSRKG